MSDDNVNRPVGSERLEEMTGDRRKGKKLPGAGFWLFFCILFVGACVLAVWLFSGLIKSGLDSVDEQPAGAVETESAAPLETSGSGPEPATGAASPPEDEEPAEKPEEQPAPSPAVNSGEALDQPVTIGQTDIYLDKDGVWRNINRGEEPAAVSKQRSGDSPLAGALTRPGSGTGLDDISTALPMVISMLGSGGQGGSGSGELGSLMDMVFGLLGSGGPSGQNSGPGDLGSMINLISGLAGSGTAGGGDFSKIFEQLGLGGLSAATGPLDQPTIDGRTQDAYRNEVRRKMTAQTLEDERRIRELQAQARKNSSGGRIESFDGFERFDPAKAGEIKSSWEYFDDPR